MRALIPILTVDETVGSSVEIEKSRTNLEVTLRSVSLPSLNSQELNDPTEVGKTEPVYLLRLKQNTHKSHRDVSERFLENGIRSFVSPM